VTSSLPSLLSLKLWRVIDGLALRKAQVFLTQRRWPFLLYGGYCLT
jgi:hypothetical protein